MVIRSFRGCGNEGNEPRKPPPFSIQGKISDSARFSFSPLFVIQSDRFLGKGWLMESLCVVPRRRKLLTDDINGTMEEVTEALLERRHLLVRGRNWVVIISSPTPYPSSVSLGSNQQTSPEKRMEKECVCPGQREYGDWGEEITWETLTTKGTCRRTTEKGLGVCVCWLGGGGGAVKYYSTRARGSLVKPRPGGSIYHSRVQTSRRSKVKY